MSKLFVDEIVHQSSQGSGTITIGASGETVALGSGATQTGFGLSGWSEDGANNNLLPASSSAGIYLGVNSATASNLLDDYEEGTWTPGMTGIGTGTVTSYGRYTKVGNLVYIAGKISISSATGTSTLEMTGFPFNGTNNSDGQTRPCIFPEGDWGGLNSSYDRVFFRMNGSTAQGVNGTSSSTYLSANELSASFNFNFHLTYLAS